MNNKTTIIDELKSRDIFNNITNEEKFTKLPKGAGIYIGFDPTAQSLHLGNYIQIATLRRFKEFGFTPIAILGGATGMIGDPSGKSEERNLLDVETLIKNKNAIRKQLESYGIEVVDNLDFYKDMNVLDFLRNVGKLLNVNYMINKDVVKSRLETGISFTEFTYQLIQGYDFKKLYDTKNVFIQVGGSDQWGNITSGIEMIRKTSGDENLAIGITTNLLTTSNGKKFGKSEGNAIWIDKKMTSPFSMYQYLLNTPDDDVKKFMNWVTLLPTEEIDKITSKHMEAPEKRYGQKELAYHIVKEVHSEEDANSAKQLSDVLFGNGEIKDLTEEQMLQLEGSIPTFEVGESKLIEVLNQVKAVSSNREAREFISNNAISLNGEVLNDENQIIKGHFKGYKTSLLRRGKKNFYLIKHV